MSVQRRKSNNHSSQVTLNFFQKKTRGDVGKKTKPKCRSAQAQEGASG